MATAIHSRALTKLVFDLKKKEITYSQIIDCCIASFRQQMLMRVLGEGVLRCPTRCMLLMTVEF